ncbi:LOW QUALITY PROTEIN: hypothetical protein HID58_092615 [Brassica napus]|uniref:Glycosyltransferase n=1 Tax=Brassica napus TaxID=3708 RepID=A0ABQ7XDR6_BRANA|nr:LOW QUALITY PROTEIN: hypothetical protein HID58_092615 [Brassica napus]
MGSNPKRLHVMFFPFMAHGQLENLLETMRPDCLIADMFFPWATQAAEKFNVPRLVFHGFGYFPLCFAYCIKLHKPQQRVTSICEPFVIPHLPGSIVMTQEQINDCDEGTEMGKFMMEVKESEVKSSCVVVNSFYEFEPDYAYFYKSVVTKRAWNIVRSLLGFEEKAERGKKASVVALCTIRNSQRNRILDITRHVS